MKSFITKKRVLIAAFILLVAGIAGLTYSVITNKSRVDNLQQHVADYEQKQTNLDKFLEGTISLSDFTKTFNDDHWQALLHTEGQDFVAEQWLFAVSVIMALFGGLVLTGFISYWAMKYLTIYLLKAAGSIRMFAHCHFDRSSIFGKFFAIFSKKKRSQMYWTSKDFSKRKVRVASLMTDEKSAGLSNDKKETPVAEEVKQATQPQPSADNAPVTQDIEVHDNYSNYMPVIGEPISVLKDLSDHVSAIREYATLQQGRMEKLQDGYDWNIIKSFCLRIIRCIDNLDIRIKKLSEQGCDTADLQEVRDELIFSLESSGIEQFEPDLNTDYRGQEKKLEVSKDRIECEDEDLAGKIAHVKRRGYCYMIEDDNMKIIRPSQVMLYA